MASLVKNIYFVSIISKLIIVGVSFISSIIVNRYLGPDLKGQYAYIFNWVAMISLILNLGIGQSYTFFKRSMKETVKQDFINIYFFQLYVYLLITAIINVFYNDLFLNVILMLGILTQFNSQIGFMALILNINKRNLLTIFISIFYILFLSVVFLCTKTNLNYIIIAYVIKIILDNTLIIVQNKIIPNSFLINKQLLKKVLVFSFFPLITSLLITFNYNIDMIILKRFVSYNEIGIYSVGVGLAGMLWIIPDAFKEVLFNKTSRSDAIIDIKFSIKFNIYLCLIVIIGFIIIGRKFIYIIYGKEFIDSYSVSVLLLIGSIPMVFFKMINTLYISIGKQKLAFYILLVSFLVNIAANFVFIPLMGIEGSAIASIFSYSICGFIFLLSFMEDYKIGFKEMLFFDDYEKLKIKSLIYK